jgi:hypothetical protein
MSPSVEEGKDRLALFAAIVPNLEVQMAVRDIKDLRERLRAAALRSSEVHDYIEIFQGGEEFENLTNL